MKLGGTCPFNSKPTSCIKKQIVKFNGGKFDISKVNEKDLKNYYCKYICKNILC